MFISTLLALPVRYKPWRPRHARLIVRDLAGGSRQPDCSPKEHLTAAIDWLCCAQDVRNDQADEGGVSAGWSFEDGWLPSYPETTGYIIETFIAAASILKRPELLERAHRMIDWELSIQREDGAFPGHFGEPGSQPVIFNTGQIMHGMLAGALQLGRNECLSSAVRAGQWLVRQQDSDGCWRRFEHNDIPHTYNTRATWALLATGMVASERNLVRSAEAHLEWALAQQTDSGWFANNAFRSGQPPFTHTIAYAIRGFLECGVLLKQPRYLNAARKAAAAVAGVQHEDGWLPGTLDSNWMSGVTYACLTGIAQMALCWLRLAQECGIEQFRDHAKRAVAFVQGKQNLRDSDCVVRGAVAGSAPIWGRYSMFEYPNWAAKFFADAVMMQMTDGPVPPVAAATDTRALAHA